MNRNVLILAGVICWSIALLDMAIHLLGGDALVPAGMTMVFVGWVGLRRHQLSRRFRSVTVEATAR